MLEDGAFIVPMGEVESLTKRAASGRPWTRPCC